MMKAMNPIDSSDPWAQTYNCWPFQRFDEFFSRFARAFRLPTFSPVLQWSDFPACSLLQLLSAKTEGAASRATKVYIHSSNASTRLSTASIVHARCSEIHLVRNNYRASSQLRACMTSDIHLKH